MELNIFIEETLIQIIKGVKSAQEKAKDYGAKVSPFYLFEGDSNAPYTKVNDVRLHVGRVNFEVALTSSDGSENKSGFGVFLGSIGVGGQEKSDTKYVSATSIKFSVPIMLPQS